MRRTTSRHLGRKTRLATVSLTVLAALGLVSTVLAGDLLVPGDAECESEPDHSKPVPEIDCKDECRYPGEITTVKRLVSCKTGTPTMGTKTCTCSTDCSYGAQRTTTTATTAIDCKTIHGETITKVGSVITWYTPTVTPNYDPHTTCTSSSSRAAPFYSTCACTACAFPTTKCDTDCKFFGTSTNAQGQYFSTGSMACSVLGDHTGCPATPTTSTTCNSHIAPTNCVANTAVPPHVDCQAVCKTATTGGVDCHHGDLTVPVTTPYPVTVTAAAFGGSKCPPYSTSCPCSPIDCTLAPSSTTTRTVVPSPNCDLVEGPGVITTATVTTYMSTATPAAFGGSACPATTKLSFLTHDCPCAPTKDAKEECGACVGMTKSVDAKGVTWAAGTKSCSVPGRCGCTNAFSKTVSACSTAAVDCVADVKNPPCIHCESICSAVPASLTSAAYSTAITTPFPHTLTSGSNYGATCAPYSTTCNCQSTDCVSSAKSATLIGNSLPPDCDTVSGASTVTYATVVSTYDVMTAARFGGKQCGPLTSSTVKTKDCPCTAPCGSTTTCDKCTMTGRSVSAGTSMSVGTARCTMAGRLGCSPTYIPGVPCHDQIADCLADTAKPPVVDCTSICQSVPEASATVGYTTPVMTPYPTTLTHSLNGGSTCAPYSTKCACSAADCKAKLATVVTLVNNPEPCCDTESGDKTITYKKYESRSTIISSARFGGSACPTLTSTSDVIKACPCTLPPNAHTSTGDCVFDGYATAPCGERFRTGKLSRTIMGRQGCPNSALSPVPCSTPVTDCKVNTAATPVLDCVGACSAVPNVQATAGFTTKLTGSYTATLTAAGNGGSECPLTTKTCPCSASNCVLSATTSYMAADPEPNCDTVFGPATVTVGRSITVYTTATPPRFGGAPCGPTTSASPITKTCPCSAPAGQTTSTGTCTYVGTSVCPAGTRYSTGTAALTAMGRKGCPSTTLGTAPCSTRIYDCVIDPGSSPKFDCGAACDAVPVPAATPGYSTVLSGSYASTMTAPSPGGSTCPTASKTCKCAPTPCALGGIKTVSTVSYMPEPSCSTLDGSTKIEWAKATTTFFVATTAKFTSPACVTTHVGCVTKDCPCDLPANPTVQCDETCAFVSTTVVPASGATPAKTVSMGKKTCTTLGRKGCPSPTAVANCEVSTMAPPPPPPPPAQSCPHYKHYGSIHPDVVIHSHVKQPTFNCNGVVAVGGDITVPQITAGHGLKAPPNVCQVPAVLVRGQLHPDCGGIVSNGAVGVSKYNTSPFPKFLSVCPALTYTTDDDFKGAYDFDSARADHKQWADDLAAMTPTLKMTRAISFSSMFDLAPAAYGGAWHNEKGYAVVSWTQNNIVGFNSWAELKANVFDAGKILVINVAPNDKGEVVIVSGDWSPMVPTQVIWNFGRATSVTLGTKWKGMVLAPSADLKGSTELEGAAICNSVIGATGFSFIHARNANGCVVGA